MNTQWPIISGASVTGPRHEKDGTGGQDAWGSFRGRFGMYGIAVADGLSTASSGGTGSSSAIAVSLKTMEKLDGEGVEISAHSVETIYEAVYSSLSEKAVREGLPVDDFGTTLIVLLYQNGKVICGQIGDGIAISGCNGVMSLLSASVTFGYVNETAVITSKNWRSDLKVSESFADSLFVATDGCQGALAIKKSGVYEPYLPFLQPLLKYMYDSREKGLNLDEAINALLLSGKMRQFSTDDKTLVVLCDKVDAQG